MEDVIMSFKIQWKVFMFLEVFVHTLIFHKAPDVSLSRHWCRTLFKYPGMIGCRDSVDTKILGCSSPSSKSIKRKDCIQLTNTLPHTGLLVIPSTMQWLCNSVLACLKNNNKKWSAHAQYRCKAFAHSFYLWLSESSEVESKSKVSGTTFCDMPSCILGGWLRRPCPVYTFLKNPSTSKTKAVRSVESNFVLW